MSLVLAARRAGPDGPARSTVRMGRRSVVIDRRAWLTSAGLTLALGGLVLVALTLGEFRVGFDRVLATLGGHGSRVEEFVIYTIRLPRALTAILVGAAFGISGAIFQSLTRNPLGSPDIIGFTQGASLGAVVTITVLGLSADGAVIGAMSGGLTIAAIVYLLSWRGGVHGYRLILVGIGVTAILTSVISWLLLRARIEDAQSAYVWLVGSLNGRGWERATPLAVALAVLVPASLMLGRRLSLLEMGDELARGLGMRVERSRLALLGLGTLLVAVAVAAVGPVAFVSLAAPQVARRLTGLPYLALVPSALAGAVLMLASDLVAQRAFAPTQLPVGVALVTVGGGYLLWLLLTENRRGRG